jgi:UrcA family protein
MKTLTLTAVAAALVSTLAVAPAQAEVLRVAVTYGDLDIHSATGAAELADRIQSDAGQACARTVDLREVIQTAQCKQSLVADAVTVLNGRGATLAADTLAARN